MMHLPPSRQPGPAVAVFEVVGCHRDDPRVLLLRAGDGRYYRQALPDGQPVEVVPGDEWLLDGPSPTGPRSVMAVRRAA